MGTSKVDYPELVDRVFPVDYQRHLPRALRTAYAAVDEAIGTIRFLAAPSGRQLRGDLIVAAVDHQLTELMDTGLIPKPRSRSFRFEPNQSQTSKHLELLFDECVVTVSQVSYPRAFPRFAYFRDNLRLNNEPDLPFEEFASEPIDEGKPHLVITHGYKDLEFVRIGLPHYRARYWHFQKALLSSATDGSTVTPFDAPRPIEDQALVKLKPVVERALKKHRDEDAAG